MLDKMKRYKAWALSLSCVVLLSGCSFSFVYNHLDWWANWYLDDYVILDDEQQIAFDSAFEQLHLWHRQTQLTRYADQLKRLKQQVNQGISIEQVQTHVTNMQQHWAILRAQAKPDLITLTETLTVEQRTELIEALEENNKERVAEREVLSREQWIKEECISQQKQFRKWVGKLNKSQKQTLCQMSESFVSTFDYWMAYRTRWLQQFSLALSPEQSKAQYQQLFATLITDPESLRDEEFNRLRAQNNQAFAELFIYMMNNLTKKQLNRFNNRIEDLINDLEALAQKN